MRTLDNRIKYYELLMVYDNTKEYIKYDLPEGYHFEMYTPGDEKEWVNIHIDSGEFTSYEYGLKVFHDFYDSFIDELDKRCLFIVEDSTNKKVGTATVSLIKEKEYGYDAKVDWLAIRREYQGKKLSRPLISKVISLSNELGHDRILLHTQTTTYLAAKLYLDAGFIPFNLDEESIYGWRILNTLINHDKLKKIEKLNEEEIYDKRNITIENLLINIYKTDNLNYQVWYKNNMNKVYVLCNNKYDEYSYTEVEGKIELQKIMKFHG